MIKAVFFDFDGVLTIEGHACDAICRTLSKKFDLPYDKLEPAFHNHAKNLNLAPERFESFIDDLNEEMGSNMAVKDILEAVTSAQPNAGMISLAKQLQDKGLIVGIITDNNVERIEVLRQPFELDKYKPLIVSAKVGSGKWQNTKIFEVALEQAKVQPSEALFIDNTIDNLRFADELGMNTYWHDHDLNDVVAFRNRLHELGLQVQ
ncbi:MAG TPA: HAD family hydrolase [Candidatus Dormibacteraeota bacterium]|nr:HAD family hydrolase [Candidatus Dormibacteraeota bacterium]